MDKPDHDMIDGLPPVDDLLDGLPPDVEVLEDGSIRFYDCFGSEIRMTREQIEEIETTGKLGDPDEDMGEPYPYFNFVKVEPCTFMMGSPPDEKGRRDGETQHLVTLTKPFHIMTTPFTQAMWCRAASRRVCFSDFANSSKLGFRLVTDNITMVGNSIKLK